MFQKLRAMYSVVTGILAEREAQMRRIKKEQELAELQDVIDRRVEYFLGDRLNNVERVSASNQNRLNENSTKSLLAETSLGLELRVRKLVKAVEGLTERMEAAEKKLITVQDGTDHIPSGVAIERIRLAERSFVGVIRILKDDITVANNRFHTRLVALENNGDVGVLQAQIDALDSIRQRHFDRITSLETAVRILQEAQANQSMGVPTPIPTPGPAPEEILDNVTEHISPNTTVDDDPFGDYPVGVIPVPAFPQEPIVEPVSPAEPAEPTPPTKDTPSPFSAFPSAPPSLAFGPAPAVDIYDRKGLSGE